jgi:Chemotaxis signal transduction protein
MNDLTNASGLGQELISFRIGRQEFCVDIMDVREIRGWTPATALPDSPPFVRGVINLRGAVLPILDLGARLGLGAADPTARHVIIVAQVEKRVVGLLVDAVSDIITITEDQLQPTPDVGSDLARACVRGLLAIDGRMISYLSLTGLFPQDDLEAAA